MSVYKAISAVSLALSKEGIGKDRKNEQQGYKFRGIDDVYNALAPLLAANGLCILPRVLSRECVERTTAKGNAIFYTTVHVEFDLVSAEDNSKHTVALFGEAMDTADKSTNKAMSAAYKYMAMEVFAIPTEGDNDADATTHEVKAKSTEMSKKEFVDHCTAMSDAVEIGEEALKSAFKTAYKAAKGYGDEQAMTSLTAKYEEAKAMLKAPA